MKKFTNNSRWGLIAMGLNLVILIMVVISAVKVSSYDSKNMYLQDSIMPKYTYWTDSLTTTQSAISKKQNSLDGYTKLLQETEAAAKETAAKLAADPQNEELINKYYSDTTHLADYTTNITRLNTEIAAYKDTLGFAQKGLAPWTKKYNDALAEVTPNMVAYNTIIIIAAILLLIKIFVFAFWMYLNTNNVRLVAPWMRQNSKVMTILAWFIPLYNLFKPCGLFSEMVSETKYALRDKSIISDAKDSNQMESVGFWWGSFIFAKIIMPFFVGGLTIAFNFWLLILSGFIDMDTATNSLGILSFGTYFGNTGLYTYLRPHALVLVIFVLAWIVYLAYECYLIMSYNKLNKLLCDNESSFNFDEVKEAPKATKKEETKKAEEKKEEPKAEETQVEKK